MPRNYYIGDTHPFIENDGRFETITIEKLRSDLEKENQTKLSNDDSVVILCEMHDELKTKNRHNLPGIDIGKELRYKYGFSGKILFLSFLSRKYITKILPNQAIINTMGHGFMPLPSTPDDWIEQLKTVAVLDELSLKDIVDGYCKRHSLVHNTLHGLESSIDKSQNLDALEDALKQIYGIYGVDSTAILNEFRSKKGAKETPTQILSWIREKGDELIAQDDDTDFLTLKGADAIFEYKILVLDDEIDKENPANNCIVKGLQDRGAKVVVATTYAEAMKIWDEESEAYEQAIVAVVADYRLEHEEDGIKILDDKQGYHFLKEIGKDYVRPVKLFAVSSLPRRFLQASLKHFGILAEIYSKVDFPLQDEKNVNYVCDRIIDGANEGWEAIKNLPTSSEWKDIMIAYNYHLTKTGYKNRELSFCQFAKRNAESFIENGQFIDLSIDKFAPTKFDFAKKIGKKQFEPKLHDVFNYRRLLLHLYHHYSNAYKGLETKEFIQIICQLESADDSKNARQKISNLKTFFSYCGLSLTNYPLDLTIEEMWYLKNELGKSHIIEDSDKYFQIIRKVREHLKKCYETVDFVKNFIDKNNKKLFGKIGNNEAIEVLFYESGEPAIRKLDEVKVILKELYKELQSENKDKSYYKHLSEVYEKVIKEIETPVAKGRDKSSDLRTFRYFMNSVLVNEKGQNIKEEYIATFQPWAVFDTEKERKQAKKVVEEAILFVRNREKAYSKSKTDSFYTKLSKKDDDNNTRTTEWIDTYTDLIFMLDEYMKGTQEGITTGLYQINIIAEDIFKKKKKNSNNQLDSLSTEGVAERNDDDNQINIRYITGDWTEEDKNLIQAIVKQNFEKENFVSLVFDANVMEKNLRKLTSLFTGISSIEELQQYDFLFTSRKDMDNKGKSSLLGANEELNLWGWNF